MRAFRIREILLLLAFFLTVGFIFSNSLASGGESNAQSGTVSTLVGEALGLPQEVYEGPSFRGAIRSLAHMAEFALLGAEAALLVRNRRFSRVGYVWGGAVCVFVAACDEIIQLFVPGRAAEFTDLLLDTAGILCGTAFVLILLGICRALQKKRRL